MLYSCDVILSSRVLLLQRLGNGRKLDVAGALCELLVSRPTTLRRCANSP